MFRAASANEPTHDAHAVGRVLALSGVDLNDDDKCLEVLVAKGIRPWQFTGNWQAAKEIAHVIRRRRERVSEAVRTAARTLAALLTLFVLGGLTLSGLAYAADAEHGSHIAHHLARSALVVAFIVVAGAVVSCLIHSKERP